MSTAVHVRLWIQPVATTRYGDGKSGFGATTSMVSGQLLEPLDVGPVQAAVLDEDVAGFEQPDLDGPGQRSLLHPSQPGRGLVRSRGGRIGSIVETCRAREDVDQKVRIKRLRLDRATRRGVVRA